MTEPEILTGAPKVLLFDLETAPILAYTFSLFKPIIGIDQIVEMPRILCWSARWAGTKGKKVMFMSERDGKIEMLTALRDLLDEADVVVGYNSDGFDIPWTNEQFMSNGISLPSPYQPVDIYKLNKKHLRNPSGKLDYLVWNLLNQRKVKHQGFNMWKSCMNPDDPDYEKSWREMERYAKKDTLLLDPLYEAFKPFIRSVNAGLYVAKDFACTHCGSDHLQARGYSRTGAGVFQRYQCQECGGWSKDPKRIGTTNLRPLSNV